MKLLAALLLLTICPSCGSSKSGEQQNSQETIAALQRTVTEQEHEIDRLRAELAKSEKPSADPPAVVPFSVELDGSDIDDPFLGPAGSRITLFLFSDYQSAACRRFAQESLPRLKEEFLGSGKLRLVFRDLPVGAHPRAASAARFANCAGEQGRYWEAHDLLFLEDSLVSSGAFEALREKLPNIDRTKFQVCFRGRKFDHELERDSIEGKRWGAKGVPAIFLGRTEGKKRFQGVLIRGAQPYALIRAEVLRALAASQ